MNNLKTKSNKKISQLKLEVIKFDSLDVIATSIPDYWSMPLNADKDELIANPTYTNNYYDNYLNSPTLATGYYNEPTSGQ